MVMGRPHELLLFPCNGNAMEALDCVGEGFRPVGFVDDDPAKIGTTVLGLPVLGRAAFAQFPTARVLAVPGSPTSFRTRAGVVASLGIAAERFATVVHPRAAVSRHARLGHNVLMMAGVVVTANAVIGDHVVILPNSVIHHDSRIGAHTLVGAGVLVAGSVVIGEGCYLGSGARFRNDVTVARGSLIGLATTVLRSITEPGGVWVGTPARSLSVAASR
jgi:sugar O-acyltransferase (sialic acid O-acetyltransferase NeuD family)